MSKTSTPQSIFDLYKDTVFSVQNDIQLWSGFLIRAVKKYLEEFPQNNDRWFESIFSVYDINPPSYVGYLKVDKRRYLISAENAEERAKDFLNWVRSVSIVKVYNALELVLLQSIQAAYYPHLVDPLQSKSEMKKLNDAIIGDLKSASARFETRNNGHLIEYIRRKSPVFNEFLSKDIRIDRHTSWEKFFVMISMVRHIISHHALIVTSDAHNGLRSTAKDVFEEYFNLVADKNGRDVLHIKEGDGFLNLISLVNDFTLNGAKFIFGETDLRFMNFQLPGTGSV
jgi:hypothetical protein